MKRILIGLAFMVGFFWAIGCVLWGIGYLGYATQGDLDLFWAAGAWQWVFLAPWYGLGVVMLGSILWLIGDGYLDSKKP